MFSVCFSRAWPDYRSTVPLLLIFKEMAYPNQTNLIQKMLCESGWQYKYTTSKGRLASYSSCVPLQSETIICIVSWNPIILYSIYTINMVTPSPWNTSSITQYDRGLLLARRPPILYVPYYFQGEFLRHATVMRMYIKDTLIPTKARYIARLQKGGLKTTKHAIVPMYHQHCACLHGHLTNHIHHFSFTLHPIAPNSHHPLYVCIKARYIPSKKRTITHPKT